MSLPPEVEERVRTFFALPSVDPSRVVFHEKATLSRCATWNLALKVRPFAKDQRNPWRKMHTEHFWCYYLAHPGPLLPTPTLTPNHWNRGQTRAGVMVGACGAAALDADGELVSSTIRAPRPPWVTCYECLDIAARDPRYPLHEAFPDT